MQTLSMYECKHCDTRLFTEGVRAREKKREQARERERDGQETETETETEKQRNVRQRQACVCVCVKQRGAWERERELGPADGTTEPQLDERTTDGAPAVQPFSEARWT